MSGYVDRLIALRAAVSAPGDKYVPGGGPMTYDARLDVRLRRVAEQLTDAQVDDVVELINEARCWS